MLQGRHFDVKGHEIPKFNSKLTAIIYNKCCTCVFNKQRHFKSFFRSVVLLNYLGCDPESVGRFFVPDGSDKISGS